MLYDIAIIICSFLLSVSGLYFVFPSYNIHLPVIFEAVRERKVKILTVVELILWVIEEVCDNYCKYPEQYLKKYKDEDEAIDRLCKEKCDNCPLNKLN